VGNPRKRYGGGRPERRREAAAAAAASRVVGQDGWEWVAETENLMSFSPLGHKFGLIFRPTSLLMGKKKLDHRICGHGSRNVKHELINS